MVGKDGGEINWSSRLPDHATTPGQGPPRSAHYSTEEERQMARRGNKRIQMKERDRGNMAETHRGSQVSKKEGR